MSCPHDDFDVAATMNRVTRDDGTVSFMVHVEVRCIACKTRFAWIGPAIGLSFKYPTVGVGRLELRAPLEPAPYETSMLADDPESGFPANRAVGR